MVGAEGAYADAGVFAKYSTISDNSALDNDISAISRGGGVVAKAYATIRGSTISGNYSDEVGGLQILGPTGLPIASEISNSTISANSATDVNGGVGGVEISNSSVSVSNSTIAFNKSKWVMAGVGLYLHQSQLALNSSIIAGNSYGSAASDLARDDNSTVTGADNVLIDSRPTDSLGNTIHQCPLLEPLANNGGPTRTHALKQMSPAIDRGNNVGTNLSHDQRFMPRPAGAQTDIGSVEWQPGEIDDRLLVAGFDGLCDQ